MESVKKIALVTGANKGIGFEASRLLAKAGLKVLLGARDIAKGQEAAKKLVDEGLDVQTICVDVSKEESVKACKEQVEKDFGRLDVLVNNAGIMSVLGVMEETTKGLDDVYTTNVKGPFIMCQAFIPLMKKNKYGRIVNLSSGLGALSDNLGPERFSYRVSKAALNVLTIVLSHELNANDNILINSMCPGWCHTDMGGPAAPRTPAQGADTALYLGTLPDGGPTGKFFRDRKEIGF